MTGKVYRAQVKPVKRSNMIPVSPAISTAANVTSKSITIKAKQNGGDAVVRDNKECKVSSDHGGLSILSSSLDKEKRSVNILQYLS